MDTERIYRLTLDLTDEERRRLAEAAAHSGERFVDFVRRLALEGAQHYAMQTAWVSGRIA
ncbi:MAG: hypothetical protein MJB57_09940 [Gemmatimonadetes bacterium]|nr:hypothetical protein [Gemmatimonadota bacterium]